MLGVVAIYLLIINIIGFFIMGSDKKKAINNEYRIPEKKLFMVALMGGGVGTTIGMRHFRHKTKHWYFVVGMPAIAAIEFFLGFFLLQFFLTTFYSIKL
ncbi:MAG: hypothetical protein ATN36_02630 [Epulopiscium sp. Nele67-Bin005]|nr:MAG: hypothetical protein ATN36_02630 [Epulopiscium sp. Nele67-Bin005]